MLGSVLHEAHQRTETYAGDESQTTRGSRARTRRSLGASRRQPAANNAAATRTSRRRWRMSLLGESTQRPGHPRSKGALRGKVTAPRDSLRGLRGLPSPPSHGRDCAQWKLQPWHPANSNNSNQRGASQGGPTAEHSRRRLPWVPSSPPPPRKRPRSLPPARTPLAGPCPSGGPDQTALLGEAEDGGGGSSGSVVTT